MQVQKPIPNDGRSARATRTRAAILDACVRMMCAGTFQPPVVAIAGLAGCSVRSVFQHFLATSALHAEALAQPGVRRALLLHATASDTRCLDWPESMQEAVAHALVFSEPLRREQREVA